MPLKPLVASLSCAAIAVCGFAIDTVQGLEKELKALPGATNYVFHLTRDAFVDSIGLDFDSLAPDGYYIAKRGRDVVLAGRTKRSSGYALADFLKRYAGYRSFGTPLVTIAPHTDNLVLPKDFTVREEPDVPSVFSAGRRFIFDGTGPFGRSDRCVCQATHAFDSLIKPSMWKEHPEYFPFVGGKRVDPKSGPWNPCMSNPDLPKLFDEYADSFFARNPLCMGIPAGVNDGSVDCHCPGCEELWRKYGNQYVPFYNMAARRLARSHPGKLLAFIAYSERCLHVPKDLKLEPNILVEVTGTIANTFEALRSWRAAGARHLGLYEYFTAFGGPRIAPGYYPHAVADDLRAIYREFKIETFYQDYHAWAPIIDAGREYVVNELMWNMDVDVDALLDDYFKSLYGPAESPMRRFHEIAETAFMRRKRLPDWNRYLTDFNNSYQFQGYSFDDIAEMGAALAKAVKCAAGDAVISRRVSLVSKLWSFQRALIENWTVAQALDKANDPDDIAALVRRASAAIDYAENFAFSDEEVEWIRCGGKNYGKNNGDWPFKGLESSSFAPRPILERAADDACTRATKRLGPEKARAAWTRLASDTAFAPYAGTQLYLMDRKPVNLVKNGSFEKLKKEVRLSPQFTSDCDPINLAGSWATWRHPSCEKDCFYVDTGMAHAGSNSICIQKNTYGALVFTLVPGMSGDRYRVSAWVRQKSGNCVAGGKLSVSFRDDGTGKWIGADGKWVGVNNKPASISVKVPQKALEEWTPVSFTFTAPAASNGRVRIHSMVHAPNCQAAEDRIWWDDISLEKIWESPK